MPSTYKVNLAGCSTRKFTNGRSRSEFPMCAARLQSNVHFEGFCKRYFLDLLVGGGAIFELKAVESLAPRHERQLMQYLFLADVPHGKLVNLRPDRVEHKFVNNVLTRAQRTDFTVTCHAWEEIGSERLKDRTIAALRDWGTGLDLGLYSEAAAFFCGRPPEVETDVRSALAIERWVCSGFVWLLPKWPSASAPCRKSGTPHIAPIFSVFSITPTSASSSGSTSPGPRSSLRRFGKENESPEEGGEGKEYEGKENEFPESLLLFSSIFVSPIFLS